MLAGQDGGGPGQRVLVVPLCGLEALHAAWFMNQVAPITLTCPLLLGMCYSGTAPLRS
jgi:hypothetical protein